LSLLLVIQAAVCLFVLRLLVPHGVRLILAGHRIHTVCSFEVSTYRYDKTGQSLTHNTIFMSAACRNSYTAQIGGDQQFTFREAVKIALLNILMYTITHPRYLVHAQNITAVAKLVTKESTRSVYKTSTAVCNNGMPVWEALHVRSWEELDCLGYETITDIVVLGAGGLTDWAQMCAELGPEASGIPLPPTLRNITVSGFECTTATNRTVFVATAEETVLAKREGALYCERAKVQSMEDLNPCEENATVSACVGKDFDWSTLVGALRHDCLSRRIRDIFIEYAGKPHGDLIPRCSVRRNVI
jgi:hypothetical protein